VRCDTPIPETFCTNKEHLKHTSKVYCFHSCLDEGKSQILVCFFPPLCFRVSLTSYSTKNKIISCLSLCLQQLKEEKEKWETDQEKMKLSRSQEIEELKLNCEKRGKSGYQYCNLRSLQQRRFIILTLVPCVFYYFVQ
jgi:hypothetical protein